MDKRCYTFSFGHYHQVPGTSCGILYILVLSLVIFMQSPYPVLIIYEIFHLLVYYIYIHRQTGRQAGRQA